VKIDLGSGEFKKEGFISLDNSEVNPINGHRFKPDIKHDLRKGIPFKDNEVDEVYCSHFLEHINPYFLLDEIWRVCKLNAIVTIYVPLRSIEYLGHLNYFYDDDIKRDMENVNKFRDIEGRRGWFGRNINPHKFEIIEKKGRTKKICDNPNKISYVDEVKIVLKVKK